MSVTLVAGCGGRLRGSRRPLQACGGHNSESLRVMQETLFRPPQRCRGRKTTPQTGAARPTGRVRGSMGSRYFLEIERERKKVLLVAYPHRGVVSGRWVVLLHTSTAGAADPLTPTIMTTTCEDMTKTYDEVMRPKVKENIKWI